MCGGLVIAAPGTSLQVLLGVLIMLLHLLVVLKLSPYVNDHEDWTSFVSALGLLLTTLGAWALRTNDADVSAFHDDVLAGLMITISGFCIGSQLVIVVFLDCGLWERIVRARRHNDKGKKNPKMNTEIQKGSKKATRGKTAVVPTAGAEKVSKESSASNAGKLRACRKKYGANSKEYRALASRIGRK